MHPSSQTMGLSPQAFSPMKERIDENHLWVTVDDMHHGKWLYIACFMDVPEVI